MHGREATVIAVDELPTTPTPGMRVLVYVRQKGELRMVLVRRSDGSWYLHRHGATWAEAIQKLGAMRTKDAMRVLDGAWLMFKMEHSRETA